VEIERMKTGFHVRPPGENPGQADDVDTGERFHFDVSFIGTLHFRIVRQPTRR
jgi:hypothetical protein